MAYPVRVAPITPPDALEAARRMRDVLSTEIPGGDYTDQSVLGALVVDGHSVLFADMFARIENLQSRRSLVDLQRAPVGVDTDDATDALLSNLVISRSVGQFARGTVTAHFTIRADVLVPRTTRFFQNRTLVFYINNATDLFIPSTSLRPTYDAQGRVSTWSVDIDLIAARTGEAYNVPAGTFQGVDPFSPYISYVEATSDFSEGVSLETSASAIARVPSAMSLRALVNARSIDARIREAFPEIGEVLTIEAGDPEMARDLSRNRQVHVLGHFDVYVRLPLRQTSVRLMIGAAQARADGRVLTFRDSAASFVTAGVKPGSVLVLAAGVPGAPMHFKIGAVRNTEFDIVPTTPFAVATDEATVPPSITYSIGDNYPRFDNFVATTVSATATTSRSVRKDGCVLLPGGPVYAIKRIEVPSPPSALASFADPVTGIAAYTARRSTPWAHAPLAGEVLSYRIVVDNPVESQSGRAVTFLELGWPGEPLAGTEVVVTYETLAGFGAIDTLISSRAERTPNANTLARAHHPIYVSCSIPYRAVTTRTVFGTAPVPVNEAAVLKAIADYIESTPPEGLDAATLGSIAKNTDTNIKSVYPFTLSYVLILPDGRVAKYETPDLVEIAPSERSSASLINYTELGFSENYKPELLKYLTDLGVSDRVVRYRAQLSDLAMELR